MNYVPYPWEWINTWSSLCHEHYTYPVHVNRFCMYHFILHIHHIKFSSWNTEELSLGDWSEFLSLIWLAYSISVIRGLFLDPASTLLITAIHFHLTCQGKWNTLMGIIPLFPLLNMGAKMDEMCDGVEQWHGCSGYVTPLCCCDTGLNGEIVSNRTMSQIGGATVNRLYMSKMCKYEQLEEWHLNMYEY